QLIEADPSFAEWLKQGEEKEYVAEKKIAQTDIDDLESRFRIVSVVLTCLAAVSTLITVVVLLRWKLLPPLSIAARVLGSTVSALRSALDRHADGYEDIDGNQWPDPLHPKPRFSKRMAPWFLYRPVLGAAAGLAVYLGLTGGVWKVTTDPSQLAFYCLLGGLFSKSLFDLLLDKFKQFFGIEEKKLAASKK